MDETLKSVRRIYYVILAICGTLIAFGLTPQREAVYQRALIEVNAARALPWKNLRGDLLAQARDRRHQRVLIARLWLSLFPRAGAANSIEPYNRGGFDPVYHLDTFPAATPSDIDALIRHNIAVNTVEIDMSETVLRIVRLRLDAACAREQRLKREHVHSGSHPDHDWILDVVDLRLKTFKSRCGFTADEPTYDTAANCYLWRLYAAIGTEVFTLVFPSECHRGAGTAEWIIAHDSTQRIVSSGVSFRNARYVWDEIGNKPLDAAAFTLENHLLAARQQVNFLGLTFDEQLAVSVGPMLLVFCLGYLRTYLGHLRRLVYRGAEREFVSAFPWAPLFGTATGRFAGILLLLILPCFAGGTMTWRAYHLASSTVLLPTLCTVAIMLCGWNVVQLIQSIRTALQVAAPGTAPHRPDLEGCGIEIARPQVPIDSNEDDEEWPVVGV
ncbi:MAG: hypothetical protein JWM27_149 [Gemmatimonadetes bacterium]|nr:hypothetical protein [Gemmatimonadota bacterium]